MCIQTTTTHPCGHPSAQQPPTLAHCTLFRALTNRECKTPKQVVHTLENICPPCHAAIWAASLRGEASQKIAIQQGLYGADTRIPHRNPRGLGLRAEPVVRADGRPGVDVYLDVHGGMARVGGGGGEGRPATSAGGRVGASYAERDKERTARPRTAGGAAQTHCMRTEMSRVARDVGEGVPQPWHYAVVDGRELAARSGKGQKTRAKERSERGRVVDGGVVWADTVGRAF